PACVPTRRPIGQAIEESVLIPAQARTAAFPCPLSNPCASPPTEANEAFHLPRSSDPGSCSRRGGSEETKHDLSDAAEALRLLALALRSHRSCCGSRMR